MNNDQNLIAEAYNRMYLKVDEDFHDKEAAMDDLEAAAAEHRDLEAAQADVNQEKGLKKYTYEILYKTDYKYDPKTKKAISYSYKSHSSGRPDERHKFAYSDDDFWAKIERSGFSVHGDELKKAIVIKDIKPADPKEVEAETRHNKVMSDYYDNASKTGANTGD
jgi:hypothetical protein